MVFWRTVLRLLGRLGCFLVKISKQHEQLPVAPTSLVKTNHRIVEPHSDYLLHLRGGQRLMIHYGLETPIEWTVGVKKDLSKSCDRIEEGSYWMEWRLLPPESFWPEEWRS